MALDLKIVIAGVGGQGILFLARVLYEIALDMDRKILGSETHGMSQRGGSVISHVKIGDYSSPMVRQGTADLLIVLKDTELYANLPFLGRRARILLNASEDFEWLPGVWRALKEKEVPVCARDATKVAFQLGNPQGANLVLLSAGMKAGVIPVSLDQLEKAVMRVTPTRFQEGNLAAIRAGYVL